MLPHNQAKKIDYRKRNQHISFEEREQLKARLYKFSNQLSTSRIFKTSRQNINMAFNGKNFGLLHRIKTYVEKMEARNGAA